MRYATTTIKMRMRFAVVPLILTALLVSGCSNGDADPLTELLESEPDAADAAPQGVGKTDIVEDTIRKVGEDANSYEYFVGTNDSGKPCLLVYASSQDWGSSCGEAGGFSVSVANVVAWLSTNEFQDYTASENIEGVVYVWNS